MADAIYNVQGVATITGNNVCNGPCVETLNFAFQIGFQPSPYGDLEPFILPGSSSMTSSGPLAPFSPFGLSELNYYAASFNQFFDEIDIESNAFIGFTFAHSFKPEVYVPFLYGCGSQVCVDDFGLGFNGNTAPQPGILLGGRGQVTVTQTPEGGVLSYLLIGSALALVLKMK